MWPLVSWCFKMSVSARSGLLLSLVLVWWDLSRSMTARFSLSGNSILFIVDSHHISRHPRAQPLTLLLRRAPLSIRGLDHLWTRNLNSPFTRDSRQDPTRISSHHASRKEDKSDRYPGHKGGPKPSVSRSLDLLRVSPDISEVVACLAGFSQQWKDLLGNCGSSRVFQWRPFRVG